MCRYFLFNLMPMRYMILPILLVFTTITAFSQDCWTIARLKYGGGGDWYASPSALPNLVKRAKKDLGVNLCETEKSVEVLEGNLFDYPILYMTGHGKVEFREEERKVLRNYLFQGGLLWASDNYGMDESFREEMKKLFPHHEMVELGRSHPVFQSHYQLRGMPKIHKHDGKRARAYGIFVDGRSVLFYGYESDLTNGWEDPDVHNNPPPVREQAFRMGVNVISWFLQGQVAK